MNQTPRQPLEKTRWVTVVALLIPLILGAGAALADIQYERDGAVQNSFGGFDLPAQGTCPGAALQGYTGIDTRPECVALRLNLTNGGTCVSPNYSWSTGVCNDTLATDQATCEAKVDRLWNPATGVCSVVMMDDDRNNVVCALHNGTWTAGCTGSWVMPATTAYNPLLLTSTGAGDQCLRCHNSVTQYNGPRLRDTEETMFMGHKNMARKVTVGTPWGGPPFECTVAPLVHLDQDACYDAGGNWVPQNPYPGTDSGQDLNWTTGQIDLDVTPGGTNYKDLLWIYGDWLSAYPRAVYKDDPDTVANPDKPKVSYSCGRCHTTGWTSDATLKANKEPEASFPGVTWDGVADAVYGQVNLAGGVSGDTNKMSSWDEWGISCARCHGSSVDNSGGQCALACSDAATCARATNSTSPGPGCGGTWNATLSICEKPVGTPFPTYTFTSLPAVCTAVAGVLTNAAPFPAPTGMSSHHSSLTGPDAGSGFCTKPDFSTLATCNTNDGVWLTACSVAGSCDNPTYTDSLSCFQNAGTWTPITASGPCTTAGGTFYTASCSVAGVCNDPAITSSGACTGTVVGGPLNGLVRQWAATTDIIRCEDAGGHYTGTKTNRGQVITNLCMDCHRQETGGKPYDSGANPAGALKVGVYHSTLTFLSHWHGNQYLNSPHGKFSGTFAQIPTAKFGYGGPAPLYKSHFMNDGEAANTGNGCTGCHEVHSSTVTGKEPFRAECTECHDKDVNQIVHPTGLGTPIESKNHPNKACESCHMPEGLHLFRINVDETYSTIPPSALTANTNATTAPDGNYADAVWVDLDAACGQCHGGGVANVVTTGSMTAGSANLTVAATAPFTVGQRIEVADAGGYYYDDLGVNKFNDTFHGYIKSITPPNTLVLTGNATATVSGVHVEQNPVKNNAAYFTKAQLADYARGIHNDKPTAYFTYKLGSPNTLSINGRRLGFDLQRQPGELQRLQLELGRRFAGRLGPHRDAHLRRGRDLSGDPDGDPVQHRLRRADEQHQRLHAGPSAGGGWQLHDRPEHVGRDGDGHLVGCRWHRSGGHQLGRQQRGQQRHVRSVRSVHAHLHPAGQLHGPAQGGGLDRSADDRHELRAQPGVLHADRERPAVERRAGAVGGDHREAGPGHGADGLLGRRRQLLGG